MSCWWILINCRGDRRFGSHTDEQIWVTPVFCQSWWWWWQASGVEQYQWRLQRIVRGELNSARLRTRPKEWRRGGPCGGDTVMKEVLLWSAHRWCSNDEGWCLLDDMIFFFWELHEATITGTKWWWWKRKRHRIKAETKKTLDQIGSCELKAWYYGKIYKKNNLI